MGDDSPPASRNFPWRLLVASGLLALLLVAQYALFRRHTSLEIAWAYPDHFDQANYLGMTYTAYEGFRSEGIWPVLRRELGAARPTGVLFPVEGGLFLLVLGPSRLSALTMHFAHFALLQAVLFLTLAWLTRRFSPALLGLGLLLAAVTPYTAAGGMFDYRIDFSALCLFGVVLCLVVRARLFASWGWSAAAGAAASWMVLCRSLTIVYVVGVFGLFVLYVCLRWWRGRGAVALRRLAARQLGGLFVAGAVLAALTGPFFWNNRAAFYGYYGLDHFLGPQAEFRNRGLSIRTTLDSLAYYPQAIGREHLGSAFLALIALAPVTAIVLHFVRRRGLAGVATAGATDGHGLWFFLLASLLVPYTLLNLDPVKSTAVAGIVVPPLVWLGVLAVTTLSRSQRRDRRSRVAGAVLAGIALVAGSYTQVAETRRPGPFTGPRGGYNRVGELYDALAEHCRQRGWTAPRVAATCLETDYFQPIVILPYVYERHHVLINPQSERMGAYVWAVTEAEVFDEVRRSDFVILVDPAQAPSAYPFDQSIRALFPKLKALCEETLTPLRRLRIWHFDVVLYTRPTGSGRLAGSPEPTGGAVPVRPVRLGQ